MIWLLRKDVLIARNIGTAQAMRAALDRKTHIN